MPRKSYLPIKIDGKIFEARLKYAKELFGSHNYQLTFDEDRIGFNCIARPEQVMEAKYADADFSISTLDKRQNAYVTSMHYEHVKEMLEGEQFIYCTYWIVLKLSIKSKSETANTTQVFAN
jgi:hypothetical protein